MKRKWFFFYETVKGFTAFELVIAVSIVVFLSALILADFPLFGRSLTIEREAQLIALALRDTEIRAVAVRKDPLGGFFTPFGVHFNVATPRQYLIFSDLNLNAGDESDFYDTGEELETITLSQRAKIKRICMKVKSPPEDCTIEELSITFRRPAPTIEVRGVGVVVGGPPPVPLGEGDFEIEVATDDESLKRCVVIWTTGAISIEPGSCI